MINVALPKGRLGESAYERMAAAGFDRAFLTEKGIDHICVEGMTEILPGIYAVSGFPRREPVETIPTGYRSTRYRKPPAWS